MNPVDKVRDAMRKRKGGKSRDPNEWRADKVDPGKNMSWKFFILPPDGIMDLWFYQHGAHFINNQVLECPRLHDQEQCPLCQYAFDLMRDVTEKEARSKIAKAYLPSARYAVNIYFPAYNSTPAELRGKVFWYSMPQTIYDICEEAIYRDPPQEESEQPTDAYGLFYLPMKANLLVLSARRKGDYNDYGSSHLVVQKTPISNKGEDKIKEILASRHRIPEKFEARNLDVLQDIVDKLSGNSSGVSQVDSRTDIKKASEALSESKELEEESIQYETESEVEAEPEIDSEVEPEVESEIEAEQEPADNSTADIPADDPELDNLLKQLNQ